jgi:hypothetical protein
MPKNNHNLYILNKKNQSYSFINSIIARYNKTYILDIRKINTKLSKMSKVVTYMSEKQANIVTLNTKNKNNNYNTNINEKIFGLNEFIKKSIQKPITNYNNNVYLNSSIFNKKILNNKKNILTLDNTIINDTTTSTPKYSQNYGKDLIFLTLDKNIEIDRKKDINILNTLLTNNPDHLNKIKYTYYSLLNTTDQKSKEFLKKLLHESILKGTAQSYNKFKNKKL